MCSKEDDYRWNFYKDYEALERHLNHCHQVCNYTACLNEVKLSISFKSFEELQRHIQEKHSESMSAHEKMNIRNSLIVGDPEFRVKVTDTGEQRNFSSYFIPVDNGSPSKRKVIKQEKFVEDLTPIVQTLEELQLEQAEAKMYLPEKVQERDSEQRVLTAIMLKNQLRTANYMNALDLLGLNLLGVPTYCKEKLASVVKLWMNYALDESGLANELQDVVAEM